MPRFRSGTGGDMRAAGATLSAGACVVMALAAATAFAGFSGSDVFLPMAGRLAGVFPSNWYTDVWIHNPGADYAVARIFLLERGTSNPSPPYADVVVGPGETQKLWNIVETLFHREMFGALRVTCDTQELVVTSRVYSQATSADEKDSVGQDFAGVPASFAIALHEKTQILGGHQTLPSADSTFRFNFGFVETTGHTVTVRVTALDADGAEEGFKDFQVREYSQRQVAFKDHFPAVSTENTRLEVEVISGSGAVIAYGSVVANGSQDPTTFEMDYPARVLAESASAGVTGVVAGAGLSGGGSAGTVTVDVGAGDGISVAADAVSLADGGVTAAKLATNAVTSGAILDGAVSSADAVFNYAGSASMGGAATDLACAGCVGLPEISTSGAATDQVLKYNGTAVAWATDSSGLTLPFTGSVAAAFPGAAFSATNVGSGVGVSGSSNSGFGVRGSSSINYGGYFLSSSSAGVYGYTDSIGSGGVTGHNGASGPGVAGSSLGGSGGLFSTESAAGAGVVGQNGSSGRGVWGTSLGGDGVRGNSVSGSGVYGYSESIVAGGVHGRNESSGPGVLGSSVAGDGVRGQASGEDAGVRGDNPGPGAGVRGSSVSGNGGAFVSSSGIGVYAFSSGAGGAVWAVNDSAGPGVLGSSVSGNGVWGSSDGGNAGVFGKNFGTAPGVRGEGGGGGGVGGFSSTSGNGVYGYSASGTGVSGEAGSAGSGFGVYGWSLGGDGVKGESGNHDGVVGRGGRWGVYGSNSSGTPWGYLGGSTTGVYGNAGGVLTNRAAIFDGNVDVNGTLTKDGGAFRIDHPLDPERKYLYHSFVESPDMMNVYNGNVTLDEGGETVVELPEWFAALNRDFRYQLTAVGQPGPNLYIAEKAAGNRFRIAGGRPGMEVSWQITGIRQDAWANAHRIAVEEAKPAPEQGTYLHPELYGQPEETGIEWSRHPVAVQATEESRDNSGPRAPR